MLRAAGIEVNVSERSATRAGRSLDLTPRQFDLLVFLLRRADTVVTRDEIARDVWRDPLAMWTNVIAVAIHELRKQLETPGRPTVLHTVRGRGYLLGQEPVTSAAPPSRKDPSRIPSGENPS